MTKPSTRVVMVGAAGRMGRAIARRAAARDDVRVVHALHRSDDPDAVAEDSCDVVVDFSAPDALALSIDLATRQRASLIVGTTGLTEDHGRALDDAAATIAVMVASNTSVGIAVLEHVAAEAVRRLPAAFTVDIIEAHHIHKRDAPSGTAKSLASALERAGRPVPESRVHAIRAGAIPGEHEILLAGPNEVLRFRHEAASRDVFADGALLAARWMHGRAPGRYRMADALGLA